MLKVRLMYVLLAKLGRNYISISNGSKSPEKCTTKKNHKEKITVKALVQKQCFLRCNTVHIRSVLFSLSHFFIYCSVSKGIKMTLIKGHSEL